MTQIFRKRFPVKESTNLSRAIEEASIDLNEAVEQAFAKGLVNNIDDYKRYKHFKITGIRFRYRTHCEEPHRLTREDQLELDINFQPL